LTGIAVGSVDQTPGPFASASIVEPGAGIEIAAGFVGATGVGVPAGGAGVVGVVGFVGLVGSVGVVGSVGLVVPDATFVPPLYVQPNIAAVITRIITDRETFFMNALSAEKFSVDLCAEICCVGI
jgi:hypothetical protein